MNVDVQCAPWSDASSTIVLRLMMDFLFLAASLRQPCCCTTTETSSTRSVIELAIRPRLPSARIATAIGASTSLSMYFMCGISTVSRIGPMVGTCLCMTTGMSTTLLRDYACASPRSSRSFAPWHLPLLYDCNVYRSVNEQGLWNLNWFLHILNCCCFRDIMLRLDHLNMSLQNLWN